MLSSQKGLTVIELLIALALVSVVLAGLYNFFIASSTRYRLENQLAETQNQARAAMGVLVQELRGRYGPATIATTATANDTISFDRVEETGYSVAGNTATTLQDPHKAWPINGFAPAPEGAYSVRLVAGTGAGQVARTITANTATQLTVSPAWGVVPDQTSVYIMSYNKGFRGPAAGAHGLDYRIGATAPYSPLAEQIVSLAFAQPDAHTITIALTARTKNPDPNTGTYHYYTLNETIYKRN